MKFLMCLHCAPANRACRVRKPRDLQQIIGVIIGHLDEDTLRESNYLPAGQVRNCEPGSFRALAETNAWGDIVDYYFECPVCGSIYRLFADTYHGSGGSWQMVIRRQEGDRRS